MRALSTARGPALGSRHGVPLLPARPGRAHAHTPAHVACSCSRADHTLGAGRAGPNPASPAGRGPLRSPQRVPEPAERGPSPLRASSSVVAQARSPTSGISERVQRLETLVQIRKLYRNLLRAEYLLALESPVYVPPVPQEEDSANDTASVGPPSSALPGTDAAPLDESAAEEVEERTSEALKLLADMALTSAQIRVQFRELPRGYQELLLPPGGEEGASPSATLAVADSVTATCALLSERIKNEISALPMAPSAARAAVRKLNERFRPDSDSLDDDEETDPGELGERADTGSAEDPPSPLVQRLDQAERRVERFLTKRVTPAMRAAQRKGAGEVLSGLAEYSSGLWARLNGGGGTTGSTPKLPPDLPLPFSTRSSIAPLVERAIVDADRIEKQLREASVLREQKLRGAGLKGRTELAIILPNLDAKVLTLSRKLAVKTLELQMMYIYMSLEDEALDIVDGPNSVQGLPLRTGSSEELGLYVAEFCLLDEALSVLSAFVESDGPPSVFSAFDEELEQLAEQVPDLRFRLGIKDGELYARAAGLARAQLELRDSVNESLDKVKEGVGFFRRGFSLLGSDMSTSVRLFMKAALGTPLRRRETMALRRTLRDLFTFVPFTVILIIPLTPVGHVLVFGFIQRYFPEYFPSQFTTRRQEIMARYDELREQLLAAQRLAEEEGDAEELRRAAEAVARVTSSSERGAATTDEEECANDPSLSAVLQLEVQAARTLRDAFESDLEDEREERK